jgi:hypothetical protein
MKKKQGYEKGAGPFSQDDPGIRRERIKDNTPGRDISRTVDANLSANDGAVGPLKSGS